MKNKEKNYLFSDFRRFHYMVIDIFIQYVAGRFIIHWAKCLKTNPINN